MIFKYKQNIMKGRKTFMGKIDVATKQYMSHKNVIADAFNFYVYDGDNISCLFW